MTPKEALEVIDNYCVACTIIERCEECEFPTIYKALRKQVPAKPPKHDISVCPVCNSKWNYDIPYTSYCCHCGQRIDWHE